MAGNRNSGRRTRAEMSRLEAKQQEWRDNIQVSQLLQSLQSHVLGKKKMGATQIKAAEVLLSKALPNLSQATIDGNVTVTHEDEIEAILNHPAAQDEIGKPIGNA